VAVQQAAVMLHQVTLQEAALHQAELQQAARQQAQQTVPVQRVALVTELHVTLCCPEVCRNDI
jgi:hypothetical protein